DAVFSGMAARHSELMKDPVRNGDALAALEARMNERVAELALGARRREERAGADQDALRAAYPMLGRPIDPLVVGDTVMEELAAERARLLADPNSDPQRIAQLEEEMRARAASLAAASRGGHGGKRRAVAASKYPFLGDVANIDELGLEDDSYFRALAAAREALVAGSGGDGDAPTIRALEEQMRCRVRQLSSDVVKATDVDGRERDSAEASYPFLDKRPQGIPLGDLHVDDDRAFRNLAGERALLLR
ncbi:Hypothetical protein, putative, partial [Bodo saltans]